MRRMAVWRKGDWERRVYEYKGKKLIAEGYRFEYKLDGVTQCDFTGVPDYRVCVFRMRGMNRHPYGYVPKLRELPFGAENKEFEIEIS